MATARNVVILGGGDGAPTQIYDAATGDWLRTTNAPSTDDVTMVCLESGHLYLSEDDGIIHKLTLDGVFLARGHTGDNQVWTGTPLPIDSDSYAVLRRMGDVALTGLFADPFPLGDATTESHIAFVKYAWATGAPIDGEVVQIVIPGVYDAVNVIDDVVDAAITAQGWVILGGNGSIHLIGKNDGLVSELVAAQAGFFGWETSNDGFSGKCPEWIFVKGNADTTNTFAINRQTGLLEDTIPEDTVAVWNALRQGTRVFNYQAGVSFQFFDERTNVGDVYTFVMFTISLIDGSVMATDNVIQDKSSPDLIGQSSYSSPDGCSYNAATNTVILFDNNYGNLVCNLNNLTATQLWYPWIDEYDQTGPWFAGGSSVLITTLSELTIAGTVTGTGAGDKVHVYEPLTGDKIRTYPVTTGAYSAKVFDPGPKFLVCPSADDTKNYEVLAHLVRDSAP